MTDKVWLDGRIVPAKNAAIAPNDRGFLLGDGLFETMRLTEGSVPHLQRHLSRLETGCATLYLRCPDRALLQKAVADLIVATGLQSGSMRLTVTRGSGPRGLLPPVDVTPTILLTCATSSSPSMQPVRLATSRYVRDGASPLSRVKSLNYLPMVMARMEAVAAGYDDALLPGKGGVVAEASAANILLLLKGELVTPPVMDGALPGTSRARLLEGGLCREQSVPLNAWSQVASAWLISALSLQPVASVDSFTFREEPAWEEKLRAFLF